MKRIFRFTVIQWISVSSKHFTISFITSYSWDCDNNLIPNSFWSIKMTLIQRVFLKKITDWVFVAALESPHSTREIELQDSRAERWEWYKPTENFILRRVEIGCIKCENCQYLFKIIVDWYKTNNLLPGFLSELCSVLTHITGVPLWSFLSLNVYKYHEVIILRCVALTLSNSPTLTLHYDRSKAVRLGAGSLIDNYNGHQPAPPPTIKNPPVTRCRLWCSTKYYH